MRNSQMFPLLNNKTTLTILGRKSFYDTSYRMKIRLTRENFYPIIKVNILLLIKLVLVSCDSGPKNVDQTSVIDLLNTEIESGLIRLYGSEGQGDFGLPVAGGHDVNGDGFNDFAMAAMLADQNSQNSGSIYLAFGNGQINYTIDSATPNINYLKLIGGQRNENAGSEIWMDDITGDGLGDLIIARQNYSSSDPQRLGSGAVTIIIGNNALTDYAATNTDIHLSSPPADLNVFTVVGASELDRLGIWMRTGDIDGDGINDLAIGADQADAGGHTNSGSVYVIRGGSYLDQTATLSIDDPSFYGNIATIIAGDTDIQALDESFPENNHLGATLNIGDLDHNDRAELFLSATVNRAGAVLTAADAPANSAVGRSGYPRGRVYIVWDAFFPDPPWPNNFVITLENPSTQPLTIISGEVTPLFTNEHFGEEVLGGKDYNGDGSNDLFIGDITGNTTGRIAAGTGHVFFTGELLKNQSFTMNNIPDFLMISHLLGKESGAISSDTALHGDFNGDGIDDLAVSAPHGNPNGRRFAGELYILWGQNEWPETIDFANLTQPNNFTITSIFGGRGTQGTDTGDTLAYSAASGDINHDGKIDIITNEMVGNGISAESEDVGNLIIIDSNILPTN